jgi:predicted acetyltransferase
MDRELTLVEPRRRYRPLFLAMVEDYARAGESRYAHVSPARRRDFDIYVRRLRNMARGLGLRPGWVTQSTFWTIEAGAPLIVGTLQLRHRLTPQLELEGGHIGYNIAPSLRNKGYGTQQLALGLEKARDLGLERVLITCDTDNVPSARVIQKNGGVFDSEVVSDLTGKPVSRYWIAL